MLCQRQIWVDPWVLWQIIHLRYQRDQAWFCCGDGHAIQGEDEISGISLKVALEGTLKIELSPHQDIKGILIESPTKFTMVGIGAELRDSVVSATYGLSHLFRYERWTY